MLCMSGRDTDFFIMDGMTEGYFLFGMDGSGNMEVLKGCEFYEIRSGKN